MGGEGLGGQLIGIRHGSLMECVGYFNIVFESGKCHPVYVEHFELPTCQAINSYGMLTVDDHPRSQVPHLFHRGTLATGQVKSHRDLLQHVQNGA